MKPYRRYFLALYGKMEKKKMGFCIKCGHALAEGAHFCGNCGVAIGEAHTESEQRKSVYDGELHKCPNCAEMLNSFMSSCPSCGYEVRGSKSKSRVDELATKLELAESAEQKISIIRNFYIPNTKEDIYEFMKAAFEAIDTTGLIYFYETSKDPERNVDVFLSDKLAAYLDVKAKGFPEPDKSKPLPQVEEEQQDNEITEEEILERLNRARKPL